MNKCVYFLEHYDIIVISNLEETTHGDKIRND
jgi:hypothetical protein